MDLMNADDLKIDFEAPNSICRCCLSTEKRMRDITRYEQLFLDLAGILVTQSDGLPKCLCWECASLLQKAVCFKQKMLRANTILNEYLTCCDPFPIDIQDPELTKYAMPQLSCTDIMTFDIGLVKNGVYENLMHKSMSASKPPDSQTDEKPTLGTPTMTSPTLQLVDKSEKAEVKIEDEVDFDCDYDEDIPLAEYRLSSKLTDEEIKLILEDTSPLETEKTKRKKTKKKDKNKKKSRKELESFEPKATIRKKDDLDPAKIKVIMLNPEEQIKQCEEDSKTKQKFPYYCHLCFKGFIFEPKLENHMKKHSPERGTFKCKLCHMYLPTAYSLSVHSVIHTRRYECVQCGRRMVDRLSIIEHYRSQHEGLPSQFTCHLCGKVTNNYRTHRGHMRNHHGGARPQCGQCGRTFVTSAALYDHMFIHQGIKNYECETCGNRFRTRTQLKLHQLKHTDIKEYYCVECDIRFKSATSLKNHLQKTLKHKDVNTFEFVCANCEKRFETEAALRTHSLVRHEGVRPHRCSQCPAALATRSALVKHTRALHAGYRAPPGHVCATCGKAFRGKSVLVNHMRTHTGEKPFACDQCGRAFTQRSAMVTHVRLVHLKLSRHKRPTNPTQQEPLEPKPFPKQEPWPKVQAPCDVYFHVAA